VTIIGSDLAPESTQAPSAPPSNGVTTTQTDSVTSNATPRNESCLNMLHTHYRRKHMFVFSQHISKRLTLESKPIALIFYNVTCREVEDSHHFLGTVWLLMASRSSVRIHTPMYCSLPQSFDYVSYWRTSDDRNGDRLPVSLMMPVIHHEFNLNRRSERLTADEIGPS
jgi:hypothetical protein